MSTFPKIDEDFMDTQLSTFGDFEPVQDMVNPRFSEREIEQMIKEDLMSIKLSTLEGALEIINESFPRIAMMITSGWGSFALHKKIAKMLNADTHDRAGFNSPIGLALMKVFDSHSTQFKFPPLSISDDFEQDRW